MNFEVDLVIDGVHRTTVTSKLPFTDGEGRMIGVLGSYHGHHRTQARRSRVAPAKPRARRERERDPDHRADRRRQSDRIRESGVQAHHGLRPGRGDRPRLPLPATRRPRSGRGRADPPGARGESRGERRGAQLPQGRRAVLESAVHRAGAERGGRDDASHRRHQRRDRSDPLSGTARIPGQLRQPHAPAEPQSAARPPAACVDRRAAAPQGRRGRVHRSGRLQERQRQPRPQRRRPAAERGRRAARALRAHERHGGAPRRRRVRDRDDRYRRRAVADRVDGARARVDFGAGVARRHRAVRRLQHGREPVPARRRRRRNADEEGRPRDVSREGHGPQHVPVLPAGDERERGRAPESRTASAARVARQRIPAALPAAGGYRDAGRSSASRRWCAGAIRRSGWCRRRRSFRWRRRAG